VADTDVVDVDDVRSVALTTGLRQIRPNAGHDDTLDFIFPGAVKDRGVPAYLLGKAVVGMAIGDGDQVRGGAAE
jgi:hypothetical protein